MHAQIHPKCVLVTDQVSSNFIEKIKQRVFFWPASALRPILLLKKKDPNTNPHRSSESYARRTATTHGPPRVSPRLVRGAPRHSVGVTDDRENPVDGQRGGRR